MEVHVLQSAPNNNYTKYDFTTIKPETLTSGNFNVFGESGSNRQTLTFQKSQQAI